MSLIGPVVGSGEFKEAVGESVVGVPSASRGGAVGFTGVVGEGGVVSAPLAFRGGAFFDADVAREGYGGSVYGVSVYGASSVVELGPVPVCS